MSLLKRKIGMAFLAISIALGMIIGSTQSCKADTFYYDNYYHYLEYYYGLYAGSGNTYYYYYKYLPYLYYWEGGYYSDYYSYNSDSLGSKSTYYKGSTSDWDYYWDYYSYYGDYYWRNG